MLTVHCPGCGNCLQVPDEAAGKTIKCALCNCRFIAQLPQDAPSTNNTILGSASPPTAARRTELHPGDTLGEYEILSKLGQGGMGAVWKAKHKRLGRLVAVKVLSSHLLDDPVAVTRFQREVEALGRLGVDHPNLVRAYDASEINGVHFLVMELLEGEDLSRVLHARNRLPAAEACGIVVQALAGLQFAHEHGLVHRDIKPSNLMLAQGALVPTAPDEPTQHLTVVKILDMGLAHLRPNMLNADVSGGITGTHQMLGTPDYMAPEQITTPNQVDIRADLYSLGCTLYHLLSGQPPFFSNLMTQKLAGHLFNEPPPLAEFCPDLPPGLDSVVTRLMAKKREERYETPAEASRALRPYTSVQRETNLSLPTALDLSNLPPSLNPETPAAHALTPTLGGTLLPAMSPQPQNGKRGMLVAGVVLALVATVAIPVSLYLLTKKDESPSPDSNDKAVVDGKDRETKPDEKRPDEKRLEPIDLSEDFTRARQLIESGGSADEFIRKHGPGRFEIWLRAAQQDQPVGYYFVGRCYSLGVGLPQNDRRAFESYRSAAAEGLAWGQYELARALETGTGTAGNVEEALVWYERANKQSYPAAGAKVAELGYQLGEAYYRGEGKKQSFQRAADFYRKAAELGNRDSQYVLGYLLVENKTGANDRAQGVNWYRKAEAYGHLDARNSLALCYKKGVGIAKDEAKAVQLFRDAANAGHVAAMVNLAACYEKGEGVAEDVEQAIAWYEKAAAKNSSRAAEQAQKLSFELAEDWYRGRGRVKNIYRAADFYRKAAEGGHREAQFRLGWILMKGEAGTANPDEAVKWYTKAANQGHPMAKNNLGFAYERGDGVVKDLNRAFRLYDEAAASGLALAMFNLSSCYEHGKGTTADLEKAVTWCQKAANAGYAPADAHLPALWTALGEAYFFGRGKEKNIARAEEWARKGADKGNREAQYRVAMILDQGLNGPAKPEEAASYYQKASDQGHALAKLHLADLYDRGRGVTMNKFTAFRLYEQSGDLGNSQAMLRVAQCYEFGTGATRNLDEMVKWYEKADKAGNQVARKQLPHAWYLLGEALATGKGKEKNATEAIPWLTKASEGGNQGAQFRLGWLLTGGEGVPANPKEGLKWYHKAADQGNAGAMNNIGVAYEHGIGVAKDFKEAFRWYEKAANKGDTVAMDNMGLCYENGRGVERSREKALEWYRKGAEKGNEKAKEHLKKLEGTKN
jgi:TPR repeat protein/serine/threonine protein kinase